MKKLYVSGVKGFVGGAIKAALASDKLGDDFELVAPDEQLELLDPELVNRLLSKAQSDYVIHLAAQSFVPAAFADPHKTLTVNFLGTLNLLQALKAARFHGRFLYVSSGDVYGLVAPENLPITEAQPIRPRNPYAVSKAAAEALCYQWSQTEDFEVIIARPFNHIGPGQSERFVVSDFCRQAIAIKHSLREPAIEIGDIDITRDFTDVRDVIQAYFSLLETGVNGETYNVCGGKEYSIRSLLDRILSICNVNVELRQDASRMRRSEQRRTVGCYDKLHRATQWRPAIAIDVSLKDVIAYWEKQST